MSWGNPQTFSERLQADLMKPASWLYGLGNEFHRIWHNSVQQPAKLSVPVISVGNITCGGTGKTPMVISLAQYLVGTGLRVAVVSRGYKRQDKSATTVVSDGQGNFAGYKQSGDEALLIAQSVPQAVVVVSSNRAVACRRAIDEFSCQIILLDDGFQHYRVARDLDIVLLDYADELMSDRLLPSGRLREPLEQLERANQIVITKLPANVDQGRLRRIKAMAINRARHAPINTCRFNARGLTGIPFGAVQPFSSINQQPVLAFCGLARPENFFSMLKSEGLNVVGEKIFPDHHNYSTSDLQMLEQLKRSSRASLIITTQKDAVKMTDLGDTTDVLAMVLETEWPEGVPASVYNLVVSLQSSSIPGISTLKAQTPSGI